jgi:large subunit ribosomal protein L20
MSRVKRGVASHKRHKRVFYKTRGFWGQRANVFRRAKETLMRAMAFAYKSRRLRKRDFRSLFIVRLSAACKERGFSYSRFIHACKEFGTILNRKILSQMAIYDALAFDVLVSKLQSHLK